MAAAADFATTVPDLIKQYVVYFYRHIRCRPRPRTRPAHCVKEPGGVAAQDCHLRDGCAAPPSPCAATVRAYVPLQCVITAQSGLRCVCQALQKRGTRRERNIREIFSMYEVSFATLSERFYKNTTWPPVEYIAELVDHDHVFCLLYKARLLRLPPCCA
jgi:hypothetical protein